MSLPENLPPVLFENPHFARYYRTWQKNEVSIVFIPLAEICREQGFLKEAREICEAGLSTQPSSVSGRLMLARILLDLEETTQASNLVQHVLTEYPAQQEALSLAEKMRTLPKKKTERNTVETEETKTASPLSLWENPTMAKIYADQGEVRTAKRILERILAQRPEDVRALALKQSLEVQKTPSL